MIIDNKVRIRTSEELYTRKEEFLIVCDILDKLEIRYFLQTGILLGAIRQNDFIPWDWDVEISVFADEVEKKLDLLINEIIISGFTIQKYFRELFRLKVNFVGKYPRETTGYTIQAWNHNKKKKIFWRNKFKVPDELFKEMKEIEFFGKKHLAPYPPENYLKYQYGENWKTPLRSSDKSIYMTHHYSGISPIKVYFKKFINYLLK